jgi:hypothetical protein
MICAKFGENWPCGSGEHVENVKGRNDGQQAIRKARLGEVKSSTVNGLQQSITISHINLHK